MTYIHVAEGAQDVAFVSRYVLKENEDEIITIITLDWLLTLV